LDQILYNQYIARNTDCIKLKCILNVFHNKVLRRTCVTEGEVMTGIWRKQINGELQKRLTGGLHEKM